MTKDINVYELGVILEKYTSDVLDELAGKTVVNRDADTLRDIAVSVLEGDTLTKQNACDLLDLAHRIRPEGKLIKQRLEHATEKLKKRKLITWY